MLNPEAVNLISQIKRLTPVKIQSRYGTLCYTLKACFMIGRKKASLREPISFFN